MKSILYIAWKDFRLHLRSARFLVAMLFCFCFVPFVILTATEEYRQRRSDSLYGELVADSLLRHTYVWSGMRPVVVKQAEPLSVISQGVTPMLGIYNQINLNEYPLLPHPFRITNYYTMGRVDQINEGDTGGRGNQLLNAYAYTDLAGTMALIFSLLALIFSYDAFSREKEEGTLRLLLASPVSRRAFLAGKLVGGWLALMPLVLLCLLQAAGWMAYTGCPLREAEWSGLGWLLLLTWGLVVVCTLAGLLVSLLMRTSAQALTVGMLLWLGLAFIVPNVADYVAETCCPIPLYKNVQTALDKLDAERNQQVWQVRERCVQRMQVDIHMTLFNVQYLEEGFVDKWGITQKEARMQSCLLGESEPLRIRYSDRKWELQQAYLDQIGKQLRLRRYLSFLSPVQLYEKTASRLCRTSAEDYLAYMDEVRRYRQAYIDFLVRDSLFSSYAYFTTQREEEFFTTERMASLQQRRPTPEEVEAMMAQVRSRPFLDVGRMPRFRQSMPDAQGQAKSCAGTLLFFLLLSAGLLAGADRLAGSYDVR